MVAKTVYDIKWKPSPIALIVILLMVLAVMYVPSQVQSQLFINPWLGLALQIGLTFGATFFFYSGVARQKQIRIALLMLSAAGVLGIVSNLFYQATYLASAKMLVTDYIVIGLINFGALAFTLDCYRIESKKVEVPDIVDPSELPYPRIKKLTPYVCVLPIVAIAMIMHNSRYIPGGENFAIHLAFFVFAQLVLNIGGAFFFFKGETRDQKFKLSFVVVALAMALGTISNATNHLTFLRPGWRLVLNSNEFIAMNAGALIIVLVFVHWKKYLEGERVKYEKALEGKTQTGTPGPDAGAAPLAETSTATSEAEAATPTAQPAATEAGAVATPTAIPAAPITSDTCAGTTIDLTQAAEPVATSTTSNTISVKPAPRKKSKKSTNSSGKNSSGKKKSGGKDVKTAPAANEVAQSKDTSDTNV